MGEVTFKLTKPLIIELKLWCFNFQAVLNFYILYHQKTSSVKYLRYLYLQKMVCNSEKNPNYSLANFTLPEVPIPTKIGGCLSKAL